MKVPCRVQSVVVGLTGYARSGKDAFGSFLVESHGFRRIAFADKLKAFVLATCPQVRDSVSKWGWEEAKKHVVVRETLQRVGVAAREHIHPDIWVSAALDDLEPEGCYVVTDVRFLNECGAVWDLGGQVFRVQRPGVGPVNGHVSESALDCIELPTIPNDGSLDDLRAQAAQLAAELLG